MSTDMSTESRPVWVDETYAPGSLERLFLLSRALLRYSAPRFDGINRLEGENFSVEIPHGFQVCLGSPQPLAQQLHIAYDHAFSMLLASI